MFQKDDSDLKNVVGSSIESLNKSVAWFLMYVNESYTIDWDKGHELKKKKNFMLGIEDSNLTSALRTAE